ncbi:MAG: DsbE family thiol:disulfide interchange protein [Pseudomonadota bacterium]
MTRRIPVLMVLPPVVFGLLVGLFFAGLYRDNPEALPSALAGAPAPVVAFERLGDKVPLTDTHLRDSGGVKLVNFWASWCGPCRAEHPSLTALAEEGIEVHGVNYRDDPDNALGFLEELGDPFSAIGRDQTGRGAIEWGVAAVPETFVLDADGHIILRFAGPITARALDRDIRPAIERALAR